MLAVTSMQPIPSRPIQGLLIVMTMLWLPACHSAPSITDGFPRQQSLRGQSREEILASAGMPVREWQDETFTLLRYYREAPLLEESMVSSKSSRPAAHHGCWATVMLQQNRVETIQYRFAPSSVDASNDCEEIFSRCQE